jgi:hypothetical protein
MKLYTRKPPKFLYKIVYLAYKTEIFVTTTTKLNQMTSESLWFDVTFVTHARYLRWFLFDFDSPMASMNILLIAWNVVVHVIS